MTIIEAEEADPWESTCLSTFKEALSSKPQFRERKKVGKQPTDHTTQDGLALPQSHTEQTGTQRDCGEGKLKHAMSLIF